MIYFNLMMNFESGYQYFDSLERAKHPVVSRYCRRELWVVKAQMLMALDRHAEAVDYLNRAMALKDENNDPLRDILYSYGRHHLYGCRHYQHSCRVRFP